MYHTIPFFFPRFRKLMRNEPKIINIISAFSASQRNTVAAKARSRRRRNRSSCVDSAIAYEGNRSKDVNAALARAVYEGGHSVTPSLPTALLHPGLSFFLPLRPTSDKLLSQLVSTTTRREVIKTTGSQIDGRRACRWCMGTVGWRLRWCLWPVTRWRYCHYINTRLGKIATRVRGRPILRI